MTSIKYFVEHQWICLIISMTMSLSACHVNENVELPARKPPLGWNSFDSYGVYLHEKAAMENLEAMGEKLKPYGYEYFVIDAGWFGEYDLVDGSLLPKEKHAKRLNINEYGLLQPSKCYFPNGLQPIIDRCHELGLKFGLHLMRGIPRQAVEENTLIKGTVYHARDIADTTSICPWNSQNYGVDMDKPGAQDFYNSLLNQMAAWGVDFIKYDDIVPYPKEIEAVAHAIDQTGRPIVLSLSPGDHVDENTIDIFKRGNMLRVTSDIWDDQTGIDKCFAAWRKWYGKAEPGFWIDMDMIPFGQLQMMAPKPAGVSCKETREEILRRKAAMELPDVVLLTGKGWKRWSNFTKDQMYTFITMRALSASPLMMGGDLPSLDEFALNLITNKDMLRCNQNGVMGKLVYEKDSIEVWNTPEVGTRNGWLGVFNRNNETIMINLEDEYFDLKPDRSYEIRNIWHPGSNVHFRSLKIKGNGVVFLRYAS